MADNSNETFEDLGIDSDLVDVLARDGITAPFPIQALAIPDGLAGSDVTGRAQTGSGKTLAFGLPMIQRMTKARKQRPQGLILVPTRELANQVTEVLKPLVKARDLHTVAVYGGVSMQRQIDGLRRGVEIAIATPGRLIDLIDRREIFLDDVEIVAIDEADQMADMGFLPQVRRIMREVPDDHQTMLFSATLDGQVGTLIRKYMKDPIAHGVEAEMQTVDTSDHRFLQVHYMDKVKVAAAIANSSERTLVFTRTKHGCDRAAKELRDEGVRAVAIHGDLHQSKRQKALDSFTDGSSPVLVATNVAARGLHIDNVDTVIHFDPPDDPKTYLHRSGRTARAGESGLVVTLVEWDQLNEVLRIQKQADLNEPVVKMFSNDDRLHDLASFTPDPAAAPFRATPQRRLSGGRRRRRL